MKKIVKLYTLLFVIVAVAGCSDDKEMKYSVDPALAPTSVTTGAVSNITYLSAEVQGAASMNEGIVDRGIYIADNQNFTGAVAVSATAVDSTTGNYTVTITELTEETQYYIKSYATNFAGGTSLGEVKNFTTLTAPSQWDDLVGTWTVKEDYYNGSSWYNNQTYPITISGVPGDKFKIKINGFAPWRVAGGHTIDATVNNMQLTLLSQELLPGWDEPDYRTYSAAVKTGTFADDAGTDFPVTDIVTNEGKLQITLLGGVATYSYLIYDNDAADGSYAGYWGYCRNTTWVKQ
jgi:hypothetical protein